MVSKRQQMHTFREHVQKQIRFLDCLLNPAPLTHFGMDNCVLFKTYIRSLPWFCDYFQRSISRRNLFSHQNSKLFNFLVQTWLPNQPITATVKRKKPFKSSPWKQCSYVSDFCKSIWNCTLKKWNSAEYVLNSFPNISVLVKNGVFSAHTPIFYL